MEQVLIDNEIVQQLENNGLKEGNKEQQIKLLLTHAYTAIKMYWTMSQEDRVLASEWHKKFRRSFSLRKFLKERKTKSRKKTLPPAPPILKKEYKEKTEKETHTDTRERRTLEVRRKEFWNELLTFEGTYKRKTLLKFYYYWAEQVTGRRKMKMELETSWDTAYRLAVWSMTSYQANDEAADLHLEREKKKTTKQTVNTAEQQAIAAKREADNAKLEQEIIERKAGAVSHEEYLRMKSTQKEPSLMCSPLSLWFVAF